MVFKLTLATVTFAAVAAAANYRCVTCPDGVNTATSAACCAFFSLRDDLQENLFKNECSEDVHESLRLTFHDGVSFSLSGAYQGGDADGSILLFGDIMMNFTDNAGTDEGVDALAPFLTRHLVSFLVGLSNATASVQDGALPRPTDSVDSIHLHFADACFSSADIINLLLSHTVARSDTTVPGYQAASFDRRNPNLVHNRFFLVFKGTAVPSNRTASSMARGEVDSPLTAAV